MQYTRELLYLCSRHYHSGDLYPDCKHVQKPCRHIPRQCTVYNAVYTILHFLVDDGFMAPKVILISQCRVDMRACAACV